MFKKMFYWFGNQTESYKSGLGDIFDFEGGDHSNYKNDEETDPPKSLQHPLLTKDLKLKLNSGELKDMLADFRAHGGCVPKKKVKMIQLETDLNPEDNLYEVVLPLPKIQMNAPSVSSKDNSFSDTSLSIPEQKLEVIAKEEDPGSIIAYALTSADYDKQLTEILQGASNAPTTRKRVLSIESSTSSSMSEVKDIGQLELSGGFSSVAFTFKAANNSTAISPHIDVQFNDSTTKYYCCVYFAEYFRSLRSELIQTRNSTSQSFLSSTSESMCNATNTTNTDNINNTSNTSNTSHSSSSVNNIDSVSSASSNNLTEEIFIKSISCCIPWTASGGKSGATFCKTTDDRFILKEMSRPELTSFLKIAKVYFDYVLSAFYESRPTLLAKILGVFRISFKNSSTNNSNKMYLLVMENLFYQRNISRRFDLKGSDRNRWVHTDDPTNVVLLDENLLQSIRKSPLYIRPDCKKRLTTAIDNDSLFLSSHSVMDYSLLVGIDQEQKRLVVGIIDYIRPYTWDKRIEMVVKSVGSHGKMPTIVSPDLYRERFCDKMNQYFLCIPEG